MKSSKPKTGSVEVDMNDSKKGWIKDPDGVYNKYDNVVYVRSSGDKIYVVCNKESQTDGVVKRLTSPNCKLVSYEEWDEDEDKKWILTFFVVDDEYVVEPELN